MSTVYERNIGGGERRVCDYCGFRSEPGSATLSAEYERLSVLANALERSLDVAAAALALSAVSLGAVR
jgi:hypothetical protein